MLDESRLQTFHYTVSLIRTKIWDTRKLTDRPALFRF